MNGPRILLVEDEATMRQVLTDCLHVRGFRVITAADGEQGLEAALRQKPALILLDIMMPKSDGFSLCREVRRHLPEIPILMLTAKGGLPDKLNGFRSGADDYLAKPFDRDELLARIHALLRRTQSHRKPLRTLQLGTVQLDFDNRIATNGKRRLDFTRKEWGMLRLLAEREGQPVSRDSFLDLVWEYGSFPTTRTIDKHIAGLRRKIEPDPRNPQFIHTVHGQGYRLTLLSNGP